MRPIDTMLQYIQVYTCGERKPVDSDLWQRFELVNELCKQRSSAGDSDPLMCSPMGELNARRCIRSAWVLLGMQPVGRACATVLHRVKIRPVKRPALY
jgi:hypothetical protein